MKRVVVTGLGLVTPLGCGVPLVWNRLVAGHSGITSLTDEAYGKIPSRVGGLVPSDPDIEGGIRIEDRFSESERRSSSRAILLSLIAAEEALSQSNLLEVELTQEQKERIGVAVGMGMLDIQDVLDTGKLLEKGYSRVSPYFMPRILPNLAAGQISIKYGFQGPNHCVSTACATGAHAIGDAFNFIRANQADVMICGGTESAVNPLTMAAFSRLRALSTKFNDNPSVASRPFDKDRDGFVLGEGAGILILESLENAQGRNAKIIGEILGYGLSGDGHHLTAARDDGHGAFKAMENSLKMANISPSQVSYVNCHATSTPIGDKAEIMALRKLFQSDNINGIPISSTKGSHGHLLGAAGAVEAAITLVGLNNLEAPPSLNIDNLDKDFQNVNIVTVDNSFKFQKNKRLISLKNSFGFGGTNASICISTFH